MSNGALLIAGPAALAYGALFGASTLSAIFRAVAFLALHL